VGKRYKRKSNEKLGSRGGTSGGEGGGEHSNRGGGGGIKEKRTTKGGEFGTAFGLHPANFSVGGEVLEGSLKGKGWTMK